MALPRHLRLGMRGEQLAARRLWALDHEILSANYTTYRGEVDIITLDPSQGLHFVEVKTRSPGGRFPPSSAVDREKQKRLISVANTFLRQTDFGYRSLHFDIMEVIVYDLDKADLKLISDAFSQFALPMQRDGPAPESFWRRLWKKLFG